MKSKRPCEANEEEREIPRVKDPKVYPEKTSNGECIWVRTRIIR